jgi:hypothetical protein
VETATLLSFLHAHENDDNNDNVTPVEVSSWRKALIHHFATSNFTTLAKFVAKER